MKKNCASNWLFTKKLHTNDLQAVKRRCQYTTTRRQGTFYLIQFGISECTDLARILSSHFSVVAHANAMYRPVRLQENSKVNVSFNFHTEVILAAPDVSSLIQKTKTLL
jgi:hypothetical protein